MDIIFLNSENSKTSKPLTLLRNLADKICLKKSDKYVALSNVSMSYTWKNIKYPYKSKKFKKSALTWNRKLDLPEASYSVSDSNIILNIS